MNSSQSTNSGTEQAVSEGSILAQPDDSFDWAFFDQEIASASRQQYSMVTWCFDPDRTSFEEPPTPVPVQPDQGGDGDTAHD